MLDRGLCGDSRGGKNLGVGMASVATRSAKRELGPDWRDALGQAVRRFAVRSWGALLVGLGLAALVALASHSPTDPSLSTAAGGPPANWLGASGRLFLRFAAAPVRARRGAVLPGHRHRRAAHASTSSRPDGSDAACCSPRSARF